MGLWQHHGCVIMYQSSGASTMVVLGDTDGAMVVLWYLVVLCCTGAVP